MNKKLKKPDYDQNPNEIVNDIIEEFIARIRALKAAELFFKNNMNKMLVDFVNSRMTQAIKGKRDVYRRDIQRITAIASQKHIDVQEAIELMEDM